MKTLHPATLALALVLLAPASALAQDIVVTGKPLTETEADLKACLERKCPPDQDVKATLAHAENQMVAGDYKGSRKTLLSSIGRNRRHGENYPVPVSDLFRANGRIAEHVGEARSFQLSVLDMRDTLKQGLGEDDFRTLVAQIEVGDSRAKLGFPDEAERIYQGVEDHALRLGNTRVATFARLRQALLLAVRYEDGKSSEIRRELVAKLDQVSKQPLPGAEEFALAAEVLRARIDRKAGDASSTEAVIKAFAERGGVDRPMLVYSEPVERIDLANRGPENAPAANTMQRLTASSAVGQWADIGFWVGADGHVSDVEVLRSGGSKHWHKPVVKNVAKRLYAPLKRGGDAAPGFYMVERYTLTARFENDTTGTRLRRREPTPRLERLDLTPDNYNTPPAATAAKAE
jgi:hypothetical protein